MLKHFRTGDTQERVFSGLLGIELDQFDRDFREWARNQATRWCFDLTPPENVDELRALSEADSENAGLLGRLARAEYDNGNFERALVVARRAIGLDVN